MQLSEITPANLVETHFSGVSPEFRDLFFSRAPNLMEELKRLLFLKTQQPDHFRLLTFRTDGFSTFEWEGKARIQFAPLYVGGYAIRKTILGNSPLVNNILGTKSETDHYDLNGNYIGKLAEPANVLFVDLIEMEVDCPITSHLYNILSFEYQKANKGEANSYRIVFVENVLRECAKNGKDRFSWFQSPEGSLERVQNYLLQNELDPALTFKEKAIVRDRLKTERKLILSTKKRVHGTSSRPHQLLLIGKDLAVTATGFQKKTKEKSLGLLYQYTIGIFLWFVAVVRKNIGYSVALAIYAPFTYYFITQPMNPGAMWAVGEVRKAVLKTSDWTTFKKSGEDSLNSTQSSGLTQSNRTSAQTSAQTSGNQAMAEAATAGGAFDPSTPFQNAKARYDGMLISTDIPSVDKQTWSERMSNFKAMQIAYESNLQFSQRMGRLEQMELQLNFAVIAESSFREIEHYAESLAHLKEALIARNALSKEAITYIDGETNRLKQFKLYVWDKMVRYMLDHPYIVLNEAKDQNFVDPYIGRNFIFLEELTTSLAKEYQGFKKPKGFKAIEDLSKYYQSKKVTGNTIEDRLQKNSVLHRLSNKYNSMELRESQKRQWEILYLSYNRAQEPANFGLQLYVWSVRNAVWSMGALFTAKSREVEAIWTALENENKKKDTVAHLRETQAKVEPLIESLFHILSLEYVSIREELNKKLENDLDSTQRQVLIEGIEKSFSERTAFLNALPFGQNR